MIKIKKKNNNIMKIFLKNIIYYYKILFMIKKFFKINLKQYFYIYQNIIIIKTKKKLIKIFKYLYKNKNNKDK